MTYRWFIFIEERVLTCNYLVNQDEQNNRRYFVHNLSSYQAGIIQLNCLKNADLFLLGIYDEYPK